MRGSDSCGSISREPARKRWLGSRAGQRGETGAARHRRAECSGKTTITARLRAEHWSEGVEYLNPDEIARDRFGGWNAPNAVLQAAEWTQARREELLGARKGIAFETVFSAPDKIDFLERAVHAGYFVRLFFIGTPPSWRQRALARKAARRETKRPKRRWKRGPRARPPSPLWYVRQARMAARPRASKGLHGTLGTPNGSLIPPPRSPCLQREPVWRHRDVPPRARGRTRAMPGDAAGVRAVLRGAHRRRASRIGRAAPHVGRRATEPAVVGRARATQLGEGDAHAKTGRRRLSCGVAVRDFRVGGACGEDASRFLSPRHRQCARLGDDPCEPCQSRFGDCQQRFHGAKRTSTVSANEILHAFLCDSTHVGFKQRKHSVGNSKEARD